MLFAHAAFDHRVSDLMDAITGDEGFGERLRPPWSADKRPRLMKRLVKEHRPDGLTETDAIVTCLKRSIPFAAPATCWRMGRGGNSTSTQTQSQSDLKKNGPMKIATKRLW
jgi:hypothetical protein